MTAGAGAGAGVGVDRSASDVYLPTVTVFVAHPDAAVRNRIAELLAPSEIEVLGEAATGLDALTTIRDVVPDVALLAVELSGIDGVTLCDRLHEELPVVRVLLLADVDDERAAAGVEAGAYGCWLTAEPSLSLERAIRGTLRRGSLPTPGWARHILERYDELAADEDRALPAPVLTPIERASLEAVAEGATPDEVAAALELTSHIVRQHAGYAIMKLYRAVRDEQVVTGTGRT